MARILTGIQSSGRPHLGNVLGAILPAMELSRDSKNESFYFIADYHSLTTIKDAATRRSNVLEVAAAWLSMGFDTNRHTFYRQSDIKEVLELTWILNCFTPYPMLANAHSFKDKSDRLSDVNAGLFDYPVLMAADILLYRANGVPVGKDQKQHLEITRDIANAFNRAYDQEILVVPESLINEQVMTIPGTDGQKMSKSYGNTLDIFAGEKELKKQVMGILTDSTPLEEPKNPDTCNVFALYQLLAEPDQIAEMRKNYLGGNYGYGHAKKALLEVILEKFKEPRAKFAAFMAEPAHLEEELKKGADKARTIAAEVMDQVRAVTGF